MAVAAHKGLYDTDRDQPVLNGTRCGSCERMFFPPVGLGCPSCGATPDQLVATDLAAEGTLYSVATVHRHRGRDIEAPFAVGEVQLDSGPLIRATMAVSESEVAIGQRVAAHWVTQRVDDDGNDVIEPRFAPVGGSSAGNDEGGAA